MQLLYQFYQRFAYLFLPSQLLQLFIFLKVSISSIQQHLSQWLQFIKQMQVVLILFKELLIKKKQVLSFKCLMFKFKVFFQNLYAFFLKQNAWIFKVMLVHFFYYLLNLKLKKLYFSSDFLSYFLILLLQYFQIFSQTLYLFLSLFFPCQSEAFHQILFRGLLQEQKCL